MNKAQIIKWLKAKREEVKEQQLKTHEKLQRDFQYRFVRSRVTPMEMDFFQDQAKALVSGHKSLMQQLLTNGPERSWYSFVGDAVKIANTEDMCRLIVGKLDFKNYLPYVQLVDANREDRDATHQQWEALLRHCQSLPLKDLLTFLDTLDLTPPPYAPQPPAPRMPAIAFDRSQLLGVSK